ncbi:uncharacterized protein PSFLO_03644 [Pseudozyma flocculosa]|uniref:Uncharacterized protein n=1 Tax=Pseudozyma flocculosa TaxID=84751 RepID=A0A5C3F3B5_9BASI|nr:uncharacterized protein PSFLO_03644 [Pseudozyma flocculosa]
MFKRGPLGAPAQGSLTAAMAQLHRGQAGGCKVAKRLGRAKTAVERTAPLPTRYGAGEAKHLTATAARGLQVQTSQQAGLLSSIEVSKGGLPMDLYLGPLCSLPTTNSQHLSSSNSSSSIKNVTSRRPEGRQSRISLIVFVEVPGSHGLFTYDAILVRYGFFAWPSASKLARITLR